MDYLSRFMIHFDIPSFSMKIGGNMTHRYTDHEAFKDTCHIFFISFDLQDNGLGQDKEKFYEELFDDIPFFAFGPKVYEEKLKDKGLVPTLREALRNMYAIPEIKQAAQEYLDSSNTEDKYIKRGEFGELLLYHLLHEYFDADALISKIYFKDSKSIPAHGFDAVHVDVKNDILWLGESKLYQSGSKAIDELVHDVVGYSDSNGQKHSGHFTTDFFDSEFQIITNRIHDSKHEYPDFIKQLIDPKTKTLKRLAKINIALFAGFESEVLASYDSEDFKTKLNNEIAKLTSRAENGLSIHPWNDNLNIFLFLFPIDDKREFVSALHQKLKGGQQL